uniref:Chemokine-like receptor 1 n=1 Tax=Pelodiscus sinensis TaxID=13735 RepID=K7F135_PELSI|nr:chemokine-like receptor 1 [Pelodiscus sinensis]|eukprot:XP_006113767.1 chemokine-like receptor 1 [Pelodiscus sinensis]
MEFLQMFFLVLYSLAFLTGAPCRVERTASTVWLLNRTVSDFIFILSLPLRFVFIYFLHVDWARRLSSTITSLHMFSSAFLLTAISVHRCVLVARPEWAQKCCTASLASWVALGTWALSAGFSLRYNDLWESLFPPASTNMNFQVDPGSAKVAVALQFLAAFLIPLALSLIPALCIDHTIRLGRNRMIQATQPLNNLLCLIPIFFLFWLPYHVFFFLWISAPYFVPFKDTDSTLASVLAPAYFYSCVSPIFYLATEEEFLKYRQSTCNSHITDHAGPEPGNQPLPPPPPS